MCIVGLTSLATAARGVELLRPDGAFSIGIRSFVWTDDARDELLTEDPNDKRKVPVDIWYPAKVKADAPTAPYVPDPEGWAGVYGADAPGLLRQVRTHAVQDAEMAAGDHPFPVAVFSHGAGQSPRFYTTLLEDLASHGFVVIAISHFGAGRGSFPGRGFVEPSRNWSPPSHLHALDKDAELYAFWEPMVETLSSDQRFVLDKLARLNADDATFKARLDLQKVALAGHSRGCKAVFRTCRKDDRCKAALILDDPPPPPERRGLSQPTLIMHPAEASESMSTFTGEFMKNTTGAAYRVAIEGIEHMDFADLRYLAPDRFSARSTTPQQALKIVRSFALAFLDSALKSKSPEGVTTLAKAFPEVEIETKPSSR